MANSRSAEYSRTFPCVSVLANLDLNSKQSLEFAYWLEWLALFLEIQLMLTSWLFKLEPDALCMRKYLVEYKHT